MPIGAQRVIVRQQDHRLNPSLRDQKPVEGIFVNVWQLHHLRRVLAYYRQVTEASRLNELSPLYRWDSSTVYRFFARSLGSPGAPP